MNKKPFEPLARRLWPVCAAFALASPAGAQTAPASETPAATSQAARVGEATQSLLQRQREGREASTTARPIDGRVAELNHQRYLKSFEHAQPMWFDSGVKGK